MINRIACEYVRSDLDRIEKRTIIEFVSHAATNIRSEFVADILKTMVREGDHFKNSDLKAFPLVSYNHYEKDCNIDMHTFMDAKMNCRWDKESAIGTAMFFSTDFVEPFLNIYANMPTSDRVYMVVTVEYDECDKPYISKVVFRPLFVADWIKAPKLFDMLADKGQTFITIFNTDDDMDVVVTGESYNKLFAEPRLRRPSVTANMAFIGLRTRCSELRKFLDGYINRKINMKVKYSLPFCKQPFTPADCGLDYVMCDHMCDECDAPTPGKNIIKDTRGELAAQLVKTRAQDTIYLNEDVLHNANIGIIRQ